MKNLLLTLVFSFVLIVGKTQITLTSSDFNQGQADFVLSESTQTSLDLTTSGPNATWDFSGLIASSQYTRTHNSMSNAPLFVQALYGLFAPTTYQADYYTSATSLPFDLLPASLPVTIEDVNQFTRVTNDSLTQVGFSLVANGQEIPFRSDTVEKAYDFPLEYGNTYASRAYTEADLNPIFDAILIQYKQRSSTVDGWGTITTPFGTFDALRIKHAISEIDSVYFSFSGFGSWLQLPVPNSNIYEWWTTSQNIPLLSITTQNIGGQEQISAVEYKDSPQQGLGITNQSLNSTIRISNPAHHQLKLFTEENIYEVILYDLTGKVVKEVQNQSILNISDLPNGMFQVAVRTNKQFATFKVIVQN